MNFNSITPKKIVNTAAAFNSSGVKNITTIDIGTWPKTTAVSEVYLSSSFFTIAFQTACRNAAKIITKNTVKDISKLISD